MPDIKAYSADNMVHIFPEGTDPNVIDRTMKRYAQTGGMEDPEAQAHQSLVDKINDAPEARVGGPNSPKMSSNLQTQIGQVKAAPLSVGGDSLIDLARSSGVKTAAKVAGRGLVGSMIGSYAGGHIGEFVGGETGKDIGEVGGGMYGGYKGVKGAEYKLPSWLGHFSTPEPPPYEPYEGGAGKLIDRVRGGSGEPSFGKPGVDLQRGKVSLVPSAPAASEPEPAPHEPYGGGSATRDKLAAKVRGRGEAGTPQYGRPGVDLQRGGISPVPDSAPGETLTEKMRSGGGTPPKTPREPAQGRPRGFKLDKPAPKPGIAQKLVSRARKPFLPGKETGAFKFGFGGSPVSEDVGLTGGQQGDKMGAGGQPVGMSRRGFLKKLGTIGAGAAAAPYVGLADSVAGFANGIPSEGVIAESPSNKYTGIFGRVADTLGKYGAELGFDHNGYRFHGPAGDEALRTVPNLNSLHDAAAVAQELEQVGAFPEGKGLVNSITPHINKLLDGVDSGSSLHSEELQRFSDKIIPELENAVSSIAGGDTTGVKPINNKINRMIKSSQSKIGPPRTPRVSEQQLSQMHESAQGEFNSQHDEPLVNKVRRNR